jgi:Ca2+-binding RTX toxin-like protein
MVGAVATAYGEVTGQPRRDQCADFSECYTIPPDRYPHGCHPNGLALQGGGDNDDVSGTSLRDLLRGGRGTDGLEGDEGKDCLFGQTGSDAITGKRGDDWIRGGDGADTLEGQLADDLLQGGRGDDSFFGLGGSDSIHGGPGDDSFMYAGSDRDLIVDTQGHNQINCGKGIDKVITNEKSHVEKCEHVTRR